MKGRLLHHVPSAHYVSWKTGGHFARLYEPADLTDLQQFLQQLPDHEALLWLGLGSNSLIREGGFNGTVIHTPKALREMKLIDANTVYAQVGIVCAQLAYFAAQQHLAGGEWFAGVPGTVGGALTMNAGAFGGETWNHIARVETIDRQGQLHIREPHEYTVAYREVTIPEEEWFVAAYFQFQVTDSGIAKDKIRELLNQRKSKQPIGLPSCGSVFRNPPNDHAARLIEACGLKGYCIGDACISEKHANFIINRGHASATDIECLIHHIAEQVQQKHNVQLQREVKIFGDHAEDTSQA